MEALIAVGLAGNVVQFLQGTGALISLAKDLRNGEWRVDDNWLLDARKVSDSLINHAAVLRARLKACSATLAEEDQNLLDVATECEDAGKALILYLNNLISQSSCKIVGLAKTTWKLAWSSAKLDDFVLKLEKLRNSLTLATILAFRTSTEGNNREVLEHLRGIQQENQARQISETKTQSTIEALASIVQDQTDNTLNTLQKEIQTCLGEIKALRNNTLLADEAHDRERQILKWLDFRQITWRYEAIQSAYRETYEWIFDESDDDKDWNDFTSHLERDVTKPYFIDGKAGSGKSTLMKFIYNHPRTNAALKRWAGTSELVILHFFFWNLGTTLQKSQAGMLRALLHAMLERFPELIPAVLPKLYRNWTSSDDDIEPDYIEIKTTFERMIEKSRYLKLAIFIDGIDEFEGDHRDLSMFLRSIVFPRVKLVVSSRPINPCLAALADCPTLRLQDLTRKDMEAYVHGELSSHRLMIRLSQQFPAAAPQLPVDLVAKAEGVFLWVKLVVCLLIEGLENGDNLTELQERLEALPSDLRALYKRMFCKMHGIYQKQGAVIFQLLRKWNDIVHDQPLPGLVLNYALCAPSVVFNPNNTPITNDVYDWTMETLDMKIRSRCCGLLELRYNDKTVRGWSSAMSSKDSIPIDEVNRSSVTYLHRTVAEFVKAEEVWQEICDLTHDMAFDTSTCLASACLFPLKLGRRLGDRSVDWYLAATTHFLRTSAQLEPQMIQRYLHDVDHTMSGFWRARWASRSHEPTWWQLHWSAQPHADPRLTTEDSIEHYVSIYTFAADRGLFCHPITLPTHVNQQARFVIGLHALWSWNMKPQKYQFQLPSLDEKVSALSYILRDVAGPESEAFGSSLWKQALIVCHGLLRDSRHLDAAKLLEVSLAAAEYPKLLWQQHVDVATGPEDIMESLSPKKNRMIPKEVANVLTEIERHLTRDGTFFKGTEGLCERSIAKNRPQNGHGKGKKHRRNKKLKVRATG